MIYRERDGEGKRGQEFRINHINSCSSWHRTFGKKNFRQRALFPAV